jgi:hypothetical protein
VVDDAIDTHPSIVTLSLIAAINLVQWVPLPVTCTIFDLVRQPDVFVTACAT